MTALHVASASALVILGSAGAFAEPLKLACEYRLSVDDEGARTDITGSAWFALILAQDGSASGDSDRCARVTGSATPTRINVACEYDLGPTHVTDTFTIDRITGDFREVWAYGPERKRFQSGSCQKATAKF